MAEDPCPLHSSNQEGSTIVGTIRTADAAGIRRGILWMLFTMFVFASINTTAKYLMQTYPVPQVVWARYLFHFLVLALLLGHRLPRVATTGRLGLQLLRSFLLLVTTTLFFSTLFFLPLADATAIMFAAPIMVTALSVPLLGEQVGPRRWAGVAAGFVGTVIIIRPGSGVMQVAAALPLAAACTHALYQIATRRLSHTDRPLTTLLYTALMGALTMSAIVPFFWRAPDLIGWCLMVTLGTLGGIGHFGLIKALEAAPAAAVMPFGYSSLIWATLFGFLVFSHVPDLWTVVGALIIAGSGLYIFRREHMHRGTVGPGAGDYP